jgi:prepilin-type processing-associated H-X9-DG protein
MKPLTAAVGVHRREAFSLVELLALIVVVSVLVLLLLPRLHEARIRASRVTCVSHLKVNGLAHVTFAVDTGGPYPWQTSTNGGVGPLTNAVTADLVRIYGVLSNELTSTKLVFCPSDIRTRMKDDGFPALMQDPARHTVPSYFLGLTASKETPESILAGDRNITLSPRDGRLDWRAVTAATPAWRIGTTNEAGTAAWDPSAVHKVGGNLLMADGSVQQVHTRRLAKAAMDSAPAEWLMPADH